MIDSTIVGNELIVSSVAKQTALINHEIAGQIQSIPIPKEGKNTTPSFAQHDAFGTRYDPPNMPANKALSTPIVNRMLAEPLMLPTRGKASSCGISFTRADKSTKINPDNATTIPRIANPTDLIASLKTIDQMNDVRTTVELAIPAETEIPNIGNASVVNRPTES
jgi:hypothetical protein